jgi:hypothetical protein
MGRAAQQSSQQLPRAQGLRKQQT